MTDLSTVVTEQTTWQAAFCRLYELDRPVVPLGTIIHWRAIATALGMERPFTDQSALVTADYFYQPHSPVPSAADLDAALTADTDAAWILVPVLRPSAAAWELAERGFVDLPWFVEAEYRVRDGVDQDLRAQLGSDRYRTLRRMVRRVGEHYAWQAYTGESLTPDVWRSFDRLHRLNIERYGHSRNHFGGAVLNVLSTSPLAHSLCVFRFERRTDGVPVQAVLAIRDGDHVRLLVGGIDHATVPSAHNLYAAGYYATYQWGATHGIRVFNLGRGAPIDKLNAGANHFELLSNHLAPAGSQDSHDVRELRTRCLAAGRTMAEELGRRAARRGGHIVVPAVSAHT